MPKRLIVGAIFVSSAFLDAPSFINGGSVSLMGLLTIIYAVAIATVAISRPAATWKILLRLWPLTLLFLYSLMQLFWAPRSVQAAQTLCMQWIFLGLIALMATGGNEGTDEPAVSRMLRKCVIAGSLCFVIAFFMVGFGAEGLGVLTFVTARSFALFALLGVALFSAQWTSDSKVGLWLAVGMILLIALSLSRTALVVGLLLLPLSRLRSLKAGDMKRLLVIGVIAIAGLIYLVSSIDALRTRFLGTNSVSDYAAGEATVDTSGRLTAWAITLGSYVESPWFGKGPGSANDLIDDVLYRLEIGHPLNEYLRFLHDEGALGLVLMLAGYGQLLILTRRAYRLGVSANSPHAALHLASFLALLAALITMFTDNTASYIFVAGPLAIMVGASIRALPHESSEAVQRGAALLPEISAPNCAILPPDFQT